MKIKNTTAVRIMIYEIRESNPALVKFVVTPIIVHDILLLLQIKGYTAMIKSYGYEFVLAILKMFEEVENYEECKIILDAANGH